MAIREIAQMGNPILYRRAVEVTDPTYPEITRLANDMIDTLVHVGGSGIAAPQVYECRRLVVYRMSARLVDQAAESPDPWVVLVNPVLEPIGNETAVDTQGPLSVLLQHECDHLDGVLYPMRMTDLSKLEFNAEPGHLAQDIIDGEPVWPVLRQLVEAWPGRSQWMDG